MVLAIIVIITSLVSVNVSNIFGSTNVNVIANEISVDLYYAQQKAIEESRNYTVDFTENGYSVYPSSDILNPRITKDFSDKNISFGDENGELSPVGESIIYNRHGVPIAGSIMTFAIKNSRNTTLYLVIAPVTGKIDKLNSITE
jgi:Tfp pilus assembly protein FimT